MSSAKRDGAAPDEAAAKDGGKPPIFYLVLLLALGLPLLGKGGAVAGAVIGAALLGVPLFALIGLITILCFVLFSDYDSARQFSPMVERMRGLIDQKNLVAIPLFIMSGAIMARGEISSRLIDFARSVVGWIPGGLGISAVSACVFFAAISGSSPATVIAIGAMMGPALVDAGYGERFSHGLLTSAGSLGILIPPSIPMIIYPIVYQGEVIETELLFASGFGPGLVIATLLGGYCIVQGVRNKTPRDEFSFKQVGASFVHGFWAIMFPVLILGGIIFGVYTTVEAAAFSVVYAVVVEVWVHRAIKLDDVPKAFEETGIFLGSLLVIMVMALAFDEFLHERGVPEMLVHWMRSLDLEQWQFLLLLNAVLLAVGMMMDILSAMFIFVPLLAPVAVAMGIDPLHFGIIFIVNLEIGYLTPPVGLNLFVASTLFERPLGHIVKSVLPFIALMMIGLVMITYWPKLSVGVGHVLMGRDMPESFGRDPGAEPDEDRIPSLQEMMDGADGDGDGDGDGDDGVMSLEEMMREAEGNADDGDGDDDRVLTLEEMMEEAAENAEEAQQEEANEPPSSMRVLSLEEMMEEAGVD